MKHNFPLFGEILIKNEKNDLVDHDYRILQE